MPHATILYAEDNLFLCQAVTELLRDEGWSVEVCANGCAAMSRLACGARYDLLLLDDDLPGVTGIEIARYARGLRPYARTPIVMLSAGDHHYEALRVGADEFLHKPDDVMRLVEVVGRLLAAHRAE
ncbi:MAG TPA: response regulator [Pyrinomonadaceae bacterium]|jgi:CheY-like chemotaxis protein